MFLSGYPFSGANRMEFTIAQYFNILDTFAFVWLSLPLGLLSSYIPNPAHAE